VNLALIGYGRMGREVEAAAKAAGHEVVAVVDDTAGATRGALAEAQVAIDFTLPDAALDNIRKVSGAGLDMVVGTTGWYDHLDEARAAVNAAGTGLVWAPNFSLGVQVFFRLARDAGRLADALDEYDVYVHETHHRHKVDHPSGTARRLAEILVETLARKERWAEAPAAGAPETNTLWVGSTRSGEVPGTHIVGLEGPDDTIELRHTARGRGGFARGAVSAAAWIQGRKGFFGIEEMLADRFGDKH
jgi:4-hydroxy-tetrahydrodipicolinate reductase